MTPNWSLTPSNLKFHPKLFLLFSFFVFDTEFLYAALTVLDGTHGVDQAALELQETCLPLPLECWDLRRVPPHLTQS